MRAGLLQLTSSDDPQANAETVRQALRDAAKDKADIVLTPEVTNCLSMDSSHQKAVLKPLWQDPVLRMAQAEAKALGLWVLLGSLAVTSDPPEHRFANRSVLIDSAGQIVVTYDKLHMFDVNVSETETYRESAGYAPGARAVTAKTPWGVLGLSVCYDVRFAYLYRALAHAGAQVLTVPAAFSIGTGPAHWQPLLQARAIETGCWVLAPAQTGQHPVQAGVSRRTHGHTLVVSPWGDVVLDAGSEPGLHMVDLDLAQVAEARRRVPALEHDRRFEGPV